MFFLFALSCLLSGRIPWYLGAPGKVGHPHGLTMGYGNGWTPPSIFPFEWWHVTSPKKMFITFSQGFHPQLSAPDQPKKTENSSELKIQLFPTKSVVDLVDLPLRLIFGMNVGKQVYHTWTTSELAN